MIDLLLAVPSSVKVGLVFAGILVVYRFGVPLGASIILHALILGLWTGEGGVALAYEFANLIKPENVLLVIVILLINYFTECLTLTGRIGRTIDALKARMSSPRMLYAGLPALIGLLPMPGGALFSAPMVDSIDHDNGLEPSLKVAINYWFRHIWEYWWPLYPGVVLALKYSGVPTGMFMLIQMPMTLFTIAGGYLFILRRIPKAACKTDGGRLDRKASAAALVPIGLLVVIAVAGSYVLVGAGVARTMANLVAMLAGLIVSLAVAFRGASGKFRASLNVFTRKNTRHLGVLIIGILMFSAALRIPIGADSATLVTHMRDEFFSLGVPILVLIMVIPFISGLVTGIAMGFVGASFPLVFGLIGPDPSIGRLAATTTLAYAFGYMGMMLSPLHMCFVVTNQYFKARLFNAYAYILAPVALVCAAALVLAGIYYVAL